MTKLPFHVHAPQMVKVADLNPAPYNPRKMPPEKYEALKESIRTEGFVEPLVVQKKGLAIIGGHQRLRAVKELCIEASVAPPDLPCVVLDLDDARAKKLNMKLNNLKGEYDARMLGELLVDLYDDPKKVTVEEAQSLGFSEDEVISHMHLINPPEEVVIDGDDGGKAFGKTPTLSIEFSTPAARDRVKALLKDRSELEKKKSGDIVAALLGPTKKKTAAAKKKAKKAA